MKPDRYIRYTVVDEIWKGKGLPCVYDNTRKRSICLAPNPADAANICTAMNAMEDSAMEALKNRTGDLDPS